MKATKMEKIIVDVTVEGVIEIYDIDRETSEKLVKESGLNWSIKVAPDLIIYCSQEQLVA